MYLPQRRMLPEGKQEKSVLRRRGQSSFRLTSRSYGAMRDSPGGIIDGIIDYWALSVSLSRIEEQ